MQAKSGNGDVWKVMLDAAAMVHSNPLDLSAVPADFVSLSFYKMFGFPTGIGALLIRTENVELLDKVVPPSLLPSQPCLHAPLGQGV